MSLFNFRGAGQRLADLFGPRRSQGGFVDTGAQPSAADAPGSAERAHQSYAADLEHHAAQISDPVAATVQAWLTIHDPKTEDGGQAIKRHYDFALLVLIKKRLMDELMQLAPPDRELRAEFALAQDALEGGYRKSYGRAVAAITMELVCRYSDLMAHPEQLDLRVSQALRDQVMKVALAGPAARPG